MRRYKILENGIIPHFITWTITDWLPIFINETYCQIITDSLTHCRHERSLLVHAYVIMPTHVHSILAVEPGNNLSSILRDSRKHIAKEIVKQLREDGNKLFDWAFRNAAEKDGRPAGSYKVWEKSTHPEALDSETFTLQKLNYMQENPIRKGLVELPEYWKYSSAAFYVNGHMGPMEIDPLEL